MVHFAQQMSQSTSTKIYKDARIKKVRKSLLLQVVPSKKFNKSKKQHMMKCLTCLRLQIGVTQINLILILSYKIFIYFSLRGLLNKLLRHSSKFIFGFSSLFLNQKSFQRMQKILMNMVCLNQMSCKRGIERLKLAA